MRRYQSGVLEIGLEILLFFLVITSGLGAIVGLIFEEVEGEVAVGVLILSFCRVWLVGT